MSKYRRALYAASMILNPHYQELQAAGELTVEMRYGIIEAIDNSRNDPEYQKALSAYIDALAKERE